MNTIPVINRINKEGSKPVRLPKPCKFCGGLGHLAFGCRKRPKKPLKTKKRMKPLGKIGKALAKQSEDFKTELKPPYLCFYCQYLGIDYPLEIEFVNAEHTQSKARHPAMRFVKEGLAISCPGHNEQKGSMDIEEFLIILDDEKARGGYLS